MSNEMVTDPLPVTGEENISTIEAHLQDDPLLYRITSQAPWWLVSVIFHVLLILCAYMFSIAINIDSNGEPLFSVTTIVPRIDTIEEKKPQPVATAPDALKGRVDTPPTDPNANVSSEVEVLKEVLTNFVLGDHFEKDTPELPDMHTAPGDPDARLFHDRKSTSNASGGGGSQGPSVFQDLIGSSGLGTPGMNGGFGGGIGGGIGNGKGSGDKSFGYRTPGGGRINMVLRHKGSKKTENAVEAALRWLAYHQETDGRWDAKRYASGEKTDTAVTGLALLAFLGHGNSEKVGDYKDNVKRAIAWLKSKQAANGLIFDTTDAGGHRGEGYPGAIATLAMAEAAAMANVPETRDAAQRAVNYFTEIHQAGEGSDKQAWRYHPKMEGDTSVTGWVIMALKSARVAGLNVNHASFDGAIKYLDSVEHKGAGGDPGYAPASTYWYTVKDAHEPHRLTAIGCLCRQFLGWKKDDLQASVEGFVAKGGVPTWGGNGANVDLYYWYYGSLCTFQQDGDVWKKWNDGLMSALCPNQRMDGDETGSWDPVGAFSTEWGRVGETALGALCLEVYYRYAQQNR